MLDYGSTAAALRIASASDKREVPAEKMLMPTSVPIAHSLLQGHFQPIIASSTSEIPWAEVWR